MIKMNKFNWKMPKKVDEQIKYLKEYKNVVFNDISEKDAGDILLKYNYINVVTPFKFYFADLIDNNKPMSNINAPIKDEYGCHIYSKKVDFLEYYLLYSNERAMYRLLFEKISAFETYFNTRFIYYVTNNYQLNSKENFIYFIEAMLKNVNSINVNKDRRVHMIKIIKSFKERIIKKDNSTIKSDFSNIFVSFDRLSLGELISLFNCISYNSRNIIFNDLKRLGFCLGAETIDEFGKRMFKLNRIRNIIYHNNSLEILYNYKNIKKRTFRSDKDKDEYKKIIDSILYI
jgi:hypothetical protein